MMSRKEAREPQALIFHLRTHSFPHFAGAAIPFQTLFPFTGKLYSTFFWGNAELTAELGAQAQCSTVQMLEHVPPYRAVHARPTMQSTTGTQFHGGTHTRNCVHFPGLCPSLQQHKSHGILLSTEHLVRYWELLPGKKKENQTKAHLYSFTGGTVVSRTKKEILQGAKCDFSFPLELWEGGEKKKALDCLINVQKAASHPHFQKATRVCGFSVFGTRAQWKQACLL